MNVLHRDVASLDVHNSHIWRGAATNVWQQWTGKDIISGEDDPSTLLSPWSSARKDAPMGSQEIAPIIAFCFWR